MTWVTATGFQSRKEINNPAIVTATSVVHVTYSECRRVSNCRVTKSRIHIKTAAAKGNNIARENSAEAGLATSATPAKPIKTASHLIMVTCSFSTTAATTARKIGDVQTNVDAVAIGRSDNPVIKHIVIPHSQNALKTTHFERAA